jgi:hypothetical protein
MNMKYNEKNNNDLLFDFMYALLNCVLKLLAIFNLFFSSCQLKIINFFNIF